MYIETTNNLKGKPESFNIMCLQKEEAELIHTALEMLKDIIMQPEKDVLNITETRRLISKMLLEIKVELHATNKKADQPISDRQNAFERTLNIRAQTEDTQAFE